MGQGNICPITMRSGPATPIGVLESALAIWQAQVWRAHSSLDQSSTAWEWGVGSSITAKSRLQPLPGLSRLWDCPPSTLLPPAPFCSSTLALQFIVIKWQNTIKVQQYAPKNHVLFYFCSFCFSLSLLFSFILVFPFSLFNISKGNLLTNAVLQELSSCSHQHMVIPFGSLCSWIQVLNPYVPCPECCILDHVGSKNNQYPKLVVP